MIQLRRVFTTPQAGSEYRRHTSEAIVAETHHSLLSMLRWLTSRFLPSASTDTTSPQTIPAVQIEASHVEPLALASVTRDANGLPVFDWQAVTSWVTRVPDPNEQARAWGAAERAWLDHLCVALGPDFRVREQGSALLLSNLEPVVAQATLGYVNKSLQRILHVLDGVAEVPEWGHDLLIVFKDKESYYRYVAHYYPDEGEYAESAGMFIQAGCGHFVTVAADLPALEPIIVHELTHACVHHLPLPTWLNEGLAVNTEQRLSPPSSRPNLPQIPARHQAFWNAERIQSFWSGQSFAQVGDPNELSYALASLLTAHLATDWNNFRNFALEATHEDGGAAAAENCLNVALGALVCALLDRKRNPDWEPAPARWHSA